MRAAPPERLRFLVRAVNLLPVDLIQGPRGVGVLSDLWTGTAPRSGDLLPSLV